MLFSSTSGNCRTACNARSVSQTRIEATVRPVQAAARRKCQFKSSLQAVLPVPRGSKAIFAHGAFKRPR